MDRLFPVYLWKCWGCGKTWQARFNPGTWSPCGLDGNYGHWIGGKDVCDGWEYKYGYTCRNIERVARRVAQ